MAVGQSVRAVDGGHIKGAVAAQVPNVIEILWTTGLPNGKTGTCKVHGHYTVAPGDMQALANSLATAWSTAWGTNLAPLMHTATALQGLFVRDMTSATLPIYAGNLTAVPGTGTGNALPLENAIAVTENILGRGKGAKGRFFLGGFVVGEDTAVGGITPAAKTAIDAFGLQIFNAIKAQNLLPCVAKVHRQEYITLTGATIPERLATFTEVTSYVCRDLHWDTQRRRGN
jgi:hypothetical protein